MEKLISVIIPVYNVELYLRRCVDSVINQTYKMLEIILVDDGSTDSSGKICEEYSKTDNRIKVIHKTNGGLSDARNAGIEICKGDYITFVDSDDWIDPDLVKHLYDIIVKFNADISIGMYKKVYDNFINDKCIKEFYNVYEYAGTKALEELYVHRSFGVHAWGKLYKRNLFETIRYPKGKIYEDEFTTYKVLFDSKKVVVTDRCLYYYFIRSNSLSHDAFNEKQLDKLNAYDEALIFFNDKLPEIAPYLKYRWLDAYVVFMRDSARANTECEKLNSEYRKALEYSKGYLKCRYVDKRFKLCWIIIRISKKLFGNLVRLLKI